MTECLLRAALSARGIADISVRSAGTVARDGGGLPAETVDALASRGIDASNFRTTYLDEAALEDVDVVIGAAREHRASAVTLQPRLLTRAFTLFELARICRDIDPADIAAAPGAPRLTELVRLAASRRTHTLPNDATEDDLPDPIGQPMDAFLRCADAIEESVEMIVSRVAD